MKAIMNRHLVTEQSSEINKRSTFGPFSLASIGSEHKTIAKLEQERDNLENQCQYYRILVEEQHSRLCRQETALTTLQSKLEKITANIQANGDTVGHTVTPSQSNSKLFGRITSSHSRRPSTDSMSRAKSNPQLINCQRSESRGMTYHNRFPSITADNTANPSPVDPEPKSSLESSIPNVSISSFHSALGRSHSLVKSLRPSIDELHHIHRNGSLISRKSVISQHEKERQQQQQQDGEVAGSTAEEANDEDTSPDPVIVLSELEESLELSEQQLQQHRDKIEQLEEEMESHKALIASLEESLTYSEKQVEKHKAEAESYSREILRSNSEAKSLREHLERIRFQLADAKSTSDAEARDRDLWKSRCQDLQDEIQERRMLSRRRSRIFCF